MIKTASLSREFFIVLVPDDKFLQSILELQQKVAEIYNIFEGNNFPQLHITLDRIKKDSLSRAGEIIEDFVDSVEPVQIILDRYSCFYLTDDRHLVLKLAVTDSLQNFATELHRRLIKAGLSTIESYEDWIFHISVVNNIFADNPIPLDDFDNICLLLEGLESPASFTVERLDIWRPRLNPVEKVVKSYSLNN